MIYNLLLSQPDPRDYLYWPKKRIEDCPRSLERRDLVTRVEDQGNPVVKDMNLEPYAGLDVYVAYGQTPLDWKLRKICAVPTF